jgi:hypothetical protein
VTATQTPIQVECSPLLMEAIRVYAAEGSQRLLRGGLEVGGVLFGVHGDKRVTIQAFRKAPIEYAHGPSFVLSEKDKAALSEVVRLQETDPELKGMVPTGWFVSHSRGETVAMTSHDEAVFSEFFPAPWQVTLVIRPVRGGIARGGFFMHEGASGGEFEVEPLNAGPLAGARGSEEGRAVDVRPEVVKSHTWLWAALSFLLGAGAAAAFFLFLWKPPVPPLGLTISQEGKQLLIAWNAASIASAATATIDVKEPGGSRLLHLKEKQLLRGAYPLEYNSGDLNFRMITYSQDGSILSQENTHYLGYPADTSRELSDAREEAERLRSENAKLLHKLKQFEERVKVLDTIAVSEREVRRAPTHP